MHPMTEFPSEDPILPVLLGMALSLAVLGVAIGIWWVLVL